MSYVNAAPEYVAAAATDLANIGSTISSANTAAMGPPQTSWPREPTRCRRPLQRCSTRTHRLIRRSAPSR